MDFAKREGKERESERARAQKQRKERGEEEEKEKCLSRLSLKATRECFVSSRYVVVCALLYLCGMSGNGFFVTLFEEEEALLL